VRLGSNTCLQASAHHSDATAITGQPTAHTPLSSSINRAQHTINNTLNATPSPVLPIPQCSTYSQPDATPPSALRHQQHLVSSQPNVEPSRDIPLQRDSTHGQLNTVLTSVTPMQPTRVSAFRSLQPGSAAAEANSQGMV
jgi:hypothetical protein